MVLRRAAATAGVARLPQAGGADHVKPSRAGDGGDGGDDGTQSRHFLYSTRGTVG